MNKNKEKTVAKNKVGKIFTFYMAMIKSVA